jgi:hypothetical protein
MTKKDQAIKKLFVTHYSVISLFGSDMETDVFPFIQENWDKGHYLFNLFNEDITKEKYYDYTSYCKKNFTLKQINQFSQELSLSVEF